MWKWIHISTPYLTHRRLEWSVSRPARLTARKAPPPPHPHPSRARCHPQPVSTLWREEKPVASARNRTAMHRRSIPWPNHYTISTRVIVCVRVSVHTVAYCTFHTIRRIFPPWKKSPLGLNTGWLIVPNISNQHRANTLLSTGCVF